MTTAGAGKKTPVNGIIVLFFKLWTIKQSFPLHQIGNLVVHQLTGKHNHLLAKSQAIKVSCIIHACFLQDILYSQRIKMQITHALGSVLFWIFKVGFSNPPLLNDRNVQLPQSIKWQLHEQAQSGLTLHFLRNLFTSMHPDKAKIREMRMRSSGTITAWPHSESGLSKLQKRPTAVAVLRLKLSYCAILGFKSLKTKNWENGPAKLHFGWCHEAVRSTMDHFSIS